MRWNGGSWLTLRELRIARWWLDSKEFLSPLHRTSREILQFYADLIRVEQAHRMFDHVRSCRWSLLVSSWLSGQIRVNITCHDKSSNASDQENSDDGKGFAHHLQKHGFCFRLLAKITVESIETDTRVIVDGILTDASTGTGDARTIVDVLFAMFPTETRWTRTYFDRTLVTVERFDQTSSVHTVTEWIPQILTVFPWRIRWTETFVIDLSRRMIWRGGIVVVRWNRSTCSSVQTRILSFTEVEEENQGLIAITGFFEHMQTSEDRSDANRWTITETDRS